MKIGIISDTHDQIERIKKTVKILNKEDVKLVVHCGDIVSPFVLQFFKDLNCPIKFLFGNNTGDIVLHLEFSKKFGLKDSEFKNFYSLEIDDKKIAAYHGDVPEIIKALIECGNYDCVFIGHDHMARIEKHGNVLVVNPGTLVDKHKEGMKPPSIAVYDSKRHEAKIILIHEYPI
jgi:putative phosphoesterase